MTKRNAIVVRVTNGGVVYANDPSQDRLAGFSFGKIVGYRGESAKELGLKPGKEVSIEYDEKNQINSVMLLTA